MKRLLTIALGLTVFALTSLGAFSCNTLRGVGEDVEEGGEAIQDVAE